MYTLLSWVEYMSGSQHTLLSVYSHTLLSWTECISSTLSFLIVDAEGIADARRLAFNSPKVQCVAVKWDSESLIRDYCLCSKISTWIFKDSVSAIGTCPNQLFAWTLAGWEKLKWVIKRLILTCRRRDESSSLLLQVNEPFYDSPQLFPTS